MFISYPLRDSIRALLRSRPNKDVDVIVVTDGERILGIGDQGTGGLGIPIGKLSLYTLIGGIHPARTLPIILDVGTNNQERLNDPEYLGWRHGRITGQEYFDFVDQFVQAVKEELPGTCLQWEDFATPHARPILQRYRDQLDRKESCGGHFRVESQTADGEAKRDDAAFSYTAAWEWAGPAKAPVLHKEPLAFEYVPLSQRSEAALRLGFVTGGQFDAWVRPADMTHPLGEDR